MCYGQRTVVVNTEYLEWVQVLSGVLRASWYYAVLYIYINDILTDTDSEIRLFAEECVCYRETRIQSTDRSVSIAWNAWTTKLRIGECNI